MAAGAEVVRAEAAKRVRVPVRPGTPRTLPRPTRRRRNLGPPARWRRRRSRHRRRVPARRAARAGRRRLRARVCVIRSRRGACSPPPRDTRVPGPNRLMVGTSGDVRLRARNVSPVDVERLVGRLSGRPACRGRPERHGRRAASAEKTAVTRASRREREAAAGLFGRCGPEIADIDAEKAHNCLTLHQRLRGTGEFGGRGWPPREADRRRLRARQQREPHAHLTASRVGGHPVGTRVERAGRCPVVPFRRAVFTRSDGRLHMPLVCDQ